MVDLMTTGPMAAKQAKDFIPLTLGMKYLS